MPGLRYSDNPSQGEWYGRPFRNKVTPFGTETVEIFKIFKTPDSEDSMAKLRSFTCLGGYLGFLRGYFDYVTTKERAPFIFLGRSLFGTAQGVVYTGTYASTVYLSSTLRGGADDHWNHLLGGVMVGVLTGAKSQSMQVGIGFSFFFGVLGMMFKEAYTSTDPSAALMTFSNIQHENMPSRTVSGPWTRWRYWGLGEVPRNQPAFGPYKQLIREQSGGRWDTES